MVLAQAQTPAGNALNGKELYQKFVCYACHSYSGKDGQGTPLVPMKMTRLRFTAYLRNPRHKPAYSSKVLSDGQLADMYTYLKTLPNSAKN